MMQVRTGTRRIGHGAPAYFIADIASNHDGDLERAKELIRLAAGAGADAAKFQSFRAEKIVSDYGFSHLGTQVSHQASWKKPVFQVYQEASVPWGWMRELRAECDRAGIDFFSTPYDLEAVEMLDPLVEIFKIGSGDITWPELLRAVAAKGKPVILSTGASELGEVREAVRIIAGINPRICLLQCNTNYTGSRENLRHINLNVLRTYQALFPDAIPGLSDHTGGHLTVLGAVALGAKVIEKHFTDDDSREGPDHRFSMTPGAWRAMVGETRELEAALGSTEKIVEENEQETAVIQRRCIRAARPLAAGTTLLRGDLEMLRPAPPGSIPPSRVEEVIGKRIRSPLVRGDYLRWSGLEP